MDAIERLRFLAPGTGEREGGEKMQPFPPRYVFMTHLFILSKVSK